jgi:collagenase-like PrtC family protease
MRIVAGAKTYDEADWLLANGAAEVYCGVATLPNHYNEITCLKTDEEFARVARLARKRGKRVQLLLNESCYEKDYPEVIRRTKALVKAGCGGIVVKELAMLEALHKARLKADLMVSSVSLSFNSRTLDYYRQFGVRRVILPYQSLPHEAARIINNPYGMETEVFFHADFCCVNVDPVCRLDGWVNAYQVCRMNLTSEGKPFYMPESNVPQKLGAVYDFYHAGAQHLKLVRMRSFSDEMEVFKEARLMLALLQKGVSRADFLKLGEKLYFSLSRHDKEHGKSPGP